MLLKLKFWIKKHIEQRSQLFHLLSRYYIELNSLRRIKGGLGILPNFVILGAQKSGTSALYNYCIQHPDVHRPTRKEINYFNMNYDKAISWYRSFFPSKPIKKLYEAFGRSFLSCEASPNYLYMDHTPERMKQLLPNAKLIVILRNPVDRAYSHYHHMKRKDMEELSFEEAISAEEDRLEEDYKKRKNNPDYVGYDYNHHSYLERGKYAKQLQQWFKHYPRDQFHIIRSENSMEHPEKTMKKVFEFLDIRQNITLTNPQVRPSDYPPMQEETREKLVKYFQPYNQELYDLLHRDFNWE